MRKVKVSIYAATVLILVLGLSFLTPDEPVANGVQDKALRSQETVAKVRQFLAHASSTIDKATSLFPWDTKERNVWYPKDNAADDYPYRVIASHFFGTESDQDLYVKVLEAEKKLTSAKNGLVDGYDISKQDFERPFDSDWAIFHTAEYMKDRLLPIVDVMGIHSPWYKRLTELTNNIWNAQALWPQKNLPSFRDEVNGDLLQVLSRLAWATQDKTYLTKAVPIVDHYLFAEPLNTPGSEMKLSDHGDEVIVGISEFYFAISHMMPELQEKYRAPIHDLLDDVLEYGRRDGLVLATAQIPPKESKRGEKYTDNWGYVMNAVYMVGVIDDAPRYKDAVTEAMNAVSELKGYEWEERYPYDGYADTLESAMILLSFVPDAHLESWVNREIGRMRNLVDRVLLKNPNYLYGNIARTVMLYTFMESQGFRLSPWPEGAGLGVVVQDEMLEISIAAGSETTWNTLLVAQGPTHKTLWRMPENYPRINALPEWFIPVAHEVYVLENAVSGEKNTYTGTELIKGVPLRGVGNGDFLLYRQ